jgi:magnesium transporter
MLLTYTRDPATNTWQNNTAIPGQVISDHALWLDLWQPTIDEDRFLESILKIEVPTREDMREIEPSSRLYTENGVCVMTTSLLVGVDTPTPGVTPITFILAPNRFCTIRYNEPSSILLFASRLLRQPNNLNLAEDLFMTLLDVVIDRLSDVLETHGHTLDSLCNEVFRNHGDNPNPADPTAPVQDMQSVLRRLGGIGNVVSMARESLVSIGRLLSFVGPAAETWLKPESQSHIKSLMRDVRFLGEYADSINTKINFLLDATLGFIDIQQNKTLKILSVASVVFLPPTLIASIFGMNFQHIPGLEHPFGFGIAMAAIILAGIIPYWLFYRAKI